MELNQMVSFFNRKFLLVKKIREVIREEKMRKKKTRKEVNIVLFIAE